MPTSEVDHMEHLRVLTAQEIAAFQSTLADWEFEPQGAYMQREFIFEDFLKAFEFMTQVAALAHEQDHHPNWSNVYRRVHVKLFTHDLSGLSLKDIRLAKDMDGVFAKAQR